MNNELAILKEQIITLQRQVENKHSVLNDSLFSPENAPYYRQLADELSKSSMIPACFRGKPSDLFIAMSMGFQLGLSIEQAIQDIAVINGRPCIWGDGFLAVVMKHPDFEDIIETPIKNGNIITGFKCTIKRKNRAEKYAFFTLDDATKAGLLNKPGPWKQYTARMLQMRARSFACRDAFPDALRGIKLAEEVQDYIDADFTTETTNSSSSPKSRTEMLKQQYRQTQQGANIDDNKPMQIDNYVEVESNDKHLPEEADKNEDPSSMDDIRQQTTVVELSEEELAAITDEELDYISGLLSQKSVDSEKLAKALKYLKADSLEVMNHNQATRFVQMLDRLPSSM